MPLDLTPAMPELILFIGVLVLLLVGAFRESDAARILPPLAVLLLVVVALVTVAHDKTRTIAFGGHFVLDGYAAFLKVLILLGAGAALLLAGGFLRDERIERYEYALLALFSTLGMCMMVSANSFLALYMALELQSLPIYVLAAYHRDNLRSTEAGLKYFVLGALGLGDAALRLLAGLRLRGLGRVRRAGAALVGRGGPAAAAGCPGRARVHRRRPRVQDVGGAVPHVDARRLRGCAVAGDRVHGRPHPRSPPSGSRCGCCSARSATGSTSGSRS